MNADRSPAGVVLDVDGTLLDTNYLHVHAWWLAFRAHGYDIAMADLHRRIGMGSDQLVPDLIGRADDAVVAAHSRFYSPFLEQLRPLPGAVELAQELDRRGFRVMLATSAEASQVDTLVGALGIADDLAEVTSSGDAEKSKPDPEIVLTAVRRAGLEPARCLLVGDTVWDVQAARRAGMGCIAVTSGGIGPQELTDAGALAVYESAQQLLDSLEDSPIAALLDR